MANRTHFGLCLFILLVLGEVFSAQKCLWKEYYDSIMGNCGPCAEICKGVIHSSVTLGTEEQCRNECSAYLFSLNCTKDQYFDEMVYNCAPCSEVCNHHLITKTTEECYSKCKGYFPKMAKRCTSDQYFDDKEINCGECVQLCALNEENITNPECFTRCDTFLAKNRPVANNEYIVPNDKGKSLSTVQSEPSSSGLHPGIITAAIFGAIATITTVIVGAFFYCRYSKRNARYEQAPQNGDVENGENVGDVGGNGDSNKDLSFGDKELGPSIQESREHMAVQTTAEEHDLDAMSTQYGIPEMDSLAPSSAAHALVNANRQR